MSEAKTTFSVEEVSARYGIGRATTFRLLARGIIPSIRLTDRGSYIIPARALERWEEALGEKAIERMKGEDK